MSLGFTIGPPIGNVIVVVRLLIIDSTLIIHPPPPSGCRIWCSILVYRRVHLLPRATHIPPSKRNKWDFNNLLNSQLVAQMQALPLKSFQWRWSSNSSVILVSPWSVSQDLSLFCLWNFAAEIAEFSSITFMNAALAIYLNSEVSFFLALDNCNTLSPVFFRLVLTC